MKGTMWDGTPIQGFGTPRPRTNAERQAEFRRRHPNYQKEYRLRQKALMAEYRAKQEAEKAEKVGAVGAERLALPMPEEVFVIQMSLVGERELEPVLIEGPDNRMGRMDRMKMDVEEW